MHYSQKLETKESQRQNFCSAGDGRAVGHEVNTIRSWPHVHPGPQLSGRGKSLMYILQVNTFSIQS